MLLRFAVANHASIADRQEFSMIATSLKDRRESLILKEGLGGHPLVSTAVFYGANASGKSNMLDAIMGMRNCALYSHERGGPDTPLKVECFRLRNDCEKVPSEYEVDFIVDDVRYHFGFSATKRVVHSEWLYYFPNGRKVMLYERSGAKDISFGRSLKGRNKIIADLMRPNSLFFSAALQNDHDEISRIATFFKKIEGNNVIDASSLQLTEFFPRDAERAGRIVEFLNKIGTGICGFDIKEQKKSEKQLAMELRFIEAMKEFVKGSVDEYKEEMKENSYNVEIKHTGDGGDYYLSVAKESAGTRRLIALMDDVFNVLDNGGVMVIDEIDASLHTLACEAIISLFGNSEINKAGAQLIATTHDTNLMLSRLFRRDQIWFAEKSFEGKTCIFSLADIHTRRTDNLERGYLEGRFGAIPFSGSVDELFRG